MAVGAKSNSDEAYAHNDHVQRITEARQRLREMLDHARVQDFPQDIAYMPAEDPNDVLLNLNSAVFDFYDQVYPFESKIRKKTAWRVDVNNANIPDAVREQMNIPEAKNMQTDLWIQTITSVEIPIERKLDSTLSDRQQNMVEYQNAVVSDGENGNSAPPAPEETEPEPVSLATLPKWESWTRRYDHREHIPHVGELVREQRYRLVLPLSAVQRIYRRLCKCLQSLGLGAHISDRPFVDWREDKDAA